MGIKQEGGESRCHFAQYENGKVLNRWVQVVYVQEPSGKVVELRGAKLPDAITLYSAKPEDGNALTVLLRKPSGPTLRSFATDFLNGTRARDLVFMIVGSFLSMGLLAVLVTLLRAMNS